VSVTVDVLNDYYKWLLQTWHKHLLFDILTFISSIKPFRNNSEGAGFLQKKIFFQIHWKLCLARWQKKQKTRNKDRKPKRLSIIAKRSKHVTSQPRPQGLLASAILERKSIKINDRDHNLWARETEHPTQTLVLVGTSYMITIVYRYIVPLL